MNMYLLLFSNIQIRIIINSLNLIDNRRLYIHLEIAVVKRL